MTRLPLALQRLYLHHDASDQATQAEPSPLIDCRGQVRVMLLALARPADWATLSTVWQGVQRDLGLPAPAIAISGEASMQLWFSLAEATPVDQAAGFLVGLRMRYLGEVEPARLQLWPPAGGAMSSDPAADVPLPGRMVASERWSAFVAADLAPMFAEEPWLDLPPGDEGQARLLAGLKSITAADLALAMQSLTTARVEGGAASPTSPMAARTAPDQVPDPGAVGDDPRRFLLGVMNNDSLPWALRIEAAKALLPGQPGT